MELLGKEDDYIKVECIQFRSVQFSRSVVSDSLQPHGLQHARSPCPSPTPGVYSNSCPLSWWCHLTISSSVIPFSSHLQSLPASGSFQMSQFFTSGGQSIGVSASASVLPTNTQEWSPLGWTGWISLLSEGLSRVFSNTAVQKDQFLNALGLYNIVLPLFQDTINNNHMIHQYHLDEHKFTPLFAGLVGWLVRGWLEGRCWARTGPPKVHKYIWVSYNLKNIQATPTAQLQKNKWPNQKMGQRTK